MWDRDGANENADIEIEDDLKLYDSDGEVTMSFNLHDDGNCYWFTEPLRNANEDYLLTVRFTNEANNDKIDVSF